MKHEELMNEIKRAYTDYCLRKTKPIDFDSFCAGYGCGMDRIGKKGENHTNKQDCGENRVEGGVVSISGSVEKSTTCFGCEHEDEDIYTFEKCRLCDIERSNYTPKKGKHYRPFNDCNELIEHYQKKYESEVGCDIYFPSLYKPCIWIKSKEYGTDNLITAFDGNNESIGGSCVFIQDQWFTLQDLYENFVFLDGSCIGAIL